MELHGRQIVAGAPVASGHTRFHATDPATGAELAPGFLEATQADIDAALAAASGDRRAWRGTPPGHRAAALEDIAAGLETLGDALLDRAGAETGLPKPRLEAERGRTCAQLRMFADVIREGSWVDARIDHGQSARTPVPKPDLRRMLVPIGPVVVFGASNFPLAFSVAGGDTASALAAGCPVVVKAHPNHPGTSELVATTIAGVLRELELPPGAFGMVHGRRPETGAALCRHPGTRAIAFTGSLAGGRALFDLAAARPEPIPVFAEMGSTNPVFLLPGALRDGGAARLAVAAQQSLTAGVGQFCTNPGLLVALDDPLTTQFEQELAQHVAATAPGTMLHAGIREGYEHGCARVAGSVGVRAVVAPRPFRAGAQARAALFAVAAEDWLAQPLLGEEVFGPCTTLIRCRDDAEMELVAANLRGQLVAAVHGTAAELAARPALLANLEDAAGRLIVDGWPTGVEVCAAMHHGGPYPATTDARSTSVGTAAIARFARPVCYQDWTPELLPDELLDGNPRRILRSVDGVHTRDAQPRAGR